MLLYCLNSRQTDSGSGNNIKDRILKHQFQAVILFVFLAIFEGFALAENVVSGAGRWFPSDPEELKKTVNSFIEEAGPEPIATKIIGAISPHAGYAYSGRVAGYTYRALRDHYGSGNKPETAVVLGLSHRSRFPGVALMEGESLMTPLGRIKLDRDSAEFLLNNCPNVYFDKDRHTGEHSAENQVPFIQLSLPGVGIVAAIMGDNDERTITSLAFSLRALSKKRRIVVIASSDMYHDPSYELVSNRDRETLDKVKLMDFKGLAQQWQPENQIFCGIAPVLTLMRFADLMGCGKGEVLFYRNSGDDFPQGRGKWVVGYGSVVFTGVER
jgi:AmmeMemoRadiSam system protein B